MGLQVKAQTYTPVSVTGFTADGTSQSFSGNTGNNWFGGTIYMAIKGVGRVLRTMDVIENNTTDPRLYQVLLTPNAANSSKPIWNISFNKTSLPGSEIFHVFAITT
jgi:hypothetical protein